MNAELPLRDIHLPAEPAWWPPAPGWWVLAALALPWLVWAGHRILQWLRSRRQRRLRLRLLDRLLDGAGADPAARLAAASEALRRVARVEAPESFALRGEAWLDWLDHGLPDRPFRHGEGRALLDLPYRPDPEPSQVERLIALIRHRLQRGLQ